MDKPPDAVTWRKNSAAQLTHEAEESAVETAERLLGIGEDSRDLAWVHDQGHYFFATRNDPTGHEFFATGHAREKELRYRWEDQGEGVKVGWLLDD